MVLFCRLVFTFSLPGSRLRCDNPGLFFLHSHSHTIRRWHRRRFCNPDFRAAIPSDKSFFSDDLILYHIIEKILWFPVLFCPYSNRIRLFSRLYFFVIHPVISTLENRVNIGIILSVIYCHTKSSGILQPWFSFITHRCFAEFTPDDL